MIIDENVRYNVKLNDDEKKAIDEAVRIFDIIITNMHNHKCNYAGFRTCGYEIPELTRSLARIVDMKNDLISIKSLSSIYTHEETTEWETNV